jgi:hypothetical protein
LKHIEETIIFTQIRHFVVNPAKKLRNGSSMFLTISRLPSIDIDIMGFHQAECSNNTSTMQVEFTSQLTDIGIIFLK